MRRPFRDSPVRTGDRRAATTTEARITATALNRLGDRLGGLRIDTFPLLGCVRKSAWSSRTHTEYTGSAVLKYIGDEETVRWRDRRVTIFLDKETHSLLLMWKRGPFRSWWTEDALALAGMVHAASINHATGVAILHEVDGRLRVRYIECPPDCARAALLTRETGWDRDVPQRIAKDSQQARALCLRCPHKRRCDLQDIEDGETHDWTMKG